MTEDHALAIKGVRAALLFHSASPWDDTKRLRWLELTGSTEATTRALCDFLRSILLPPTYIVAPGDTLSGIARRFTGNIQRWGELWGANDDVIGPNPHLIHPGTVLRIPPSWVPYDYEPQP